MWEAVGGRKRPVLFELKDGSPFALAGLWERAPGKDGELVDALVILTTRPNELVGAVHDRMPVILNGDTYDAWLDVGTRSSDRLLDLLRPYPAEEMVARPASLR